MSRHVIDLHNEGSRGRNCHHEQFQGLGGKFAEKALRMISGAYAESG
jgi:hypothetical protein